jgi:hypothetical protein
MREFKIFYEGKIIDSIYADNVDELDSYWFTVNDDKVKRVVAVFTKDYSFTVNKK